MAKYAGKKAKKNDRMKEKKLKALYYNIMIRYLSYKGRKKTDYRYQGKQEIRVQNKYKQKEKKTRRK